MTFLFDKGREDTIQKPLKAGHDQPASETSFKCRFAGGPMIAPLMMVFEVFLPSKKGFQSLTFLDPRLSPSPLSDRL